MSDVASKSKTARRFEYVFWSVVLLWIFEWDIKMLGEFIEWIRHL